MKKDLASWQRLYADHDEMVGHSVYHNTSTIVVFRSGRGGKGTG